MREPPRSYDELPASGWRSIPPQFGYDGIRGGMSGVAFVFGWLYTNTRAGQLMAGPYDPALKKTWGPRLPS